MTLCKLNCLILVNLFNTVPGTAITKSAVIIVDNIEQRKKNNAGGYHLNVFHLS